MLCIVKETFAPDSNADVNKNCIAVHCLAGIGRAPLLVGILLIEYGMKANDAIQLLRANRYGAINKQQIGLLLNYRKSGSFSKACCALL